MKGIAWLTPVMLTLLILSSFSLGSDNTLKEPDDLRISSSITIHNNTEFRELAKSLGWRGNGTQKNPYIIENYNISPILGRDGFLIQNTSLYFIIRNSSIFYAYNPEEDAIGAGIKLVNVSHAVIENITFTSNEDGIYTLHSSNITVRNCKFLKNAAGVFAKYSRDLEIYRNYFEKGNVSMVVWYSSHIEILNNSMRDYHDTGIVLRFSRNLRITGNKISIVEERRLHELSEAGIWLERSNFTLIKENEIRGNCLQINGIWIRETGNITVRKNSIMQNNFGIYIGKSREDAIEKNEISFNKVDGFFIMDSSYLEIRDNNITYNYRVNRMWGGYGEWIGNGIEMSYSKENTIVGNLLAFNGMGIQIRGGPNLIYNNSFFYNHGSGDFFNATHIQARDESARNYWNTSKYGNYWRDWAQKEDSNGDGIVDKPYRLIAYNDKKVMDFRPLKEPPGQYRIEPTPPRKLRIEIGVGYLNISWLKPIGNGTSPIKGYRVYQNNVSFAFISPERCYFNDTSVKNGAKYSYYVTAVNGDGESGRTNVVRGIPGIPSQPRNLTAHSGDGYVYLTWNPPARRGASVILHYRIYRVYAGPPLCPSGEEYRTLIDAVSGNQLYYNDTNVSNGKTYGYAVSAVNSQGESPLSNRVSAVPGKIPTPPQNLSVKIKGKYVILTWNKPKDDGGSIWEYRIYCNGKLIATTSDRKLNYTYKILTTGRYAFFVTALNSNGESNPSNEVVIFYQTKSPRRDIGVIVTSISLIILLIIVGVIGNFRHSKRKSTEKSNK